MQHREARLNGRPQVVWATSASAYKMRHCWLHFRWVDRCWWARYKQVPITNSVGDRVTMRSWTLGMISSHQRLRYCCTS